MKEGREGGREGGRKEGRKEENGLLWWSVVKMLCFQCRGCWFKPQLGNEDPTCHKAKRNLKRKKRRQEGKKEGRKKEKL